MIAARLGHTNPYIKRPGRYVFHIFFDIFWGGPDEVGCQRSLPGGFASQEVRLSIRDVGVTSPEGAKTSFLRCFRIFGRQRGQILQGKGRDKHWRGVIGSKRLELLTFGNDKVQKAQKGKIDRFYYFLYFFPNIWPLAGPNIKKKGRPFRKLARGDRQTHFGTFNFQVKP